MRGPGRRVHRRERRSGHVLLRGAYHLGNRHIAVQLGPGWLRYLHDHVLDDMLRGLGLEVDFAQLPFEPEAGAYGPAVPFTATRMRPWP